MAARKRSPKSPVCLVRVVVDHDGIHFEPPAPFEPPTKLEFGRVTAVPHKSPRPVFTLEEDNVIWMWTGGSILSFGAMEHGVIRLKPPATATDELVEGVKAELLAAGALAVRVLPRPRAEPLVKEVREPAVARETLREAALHVASTLASGDQVALLERVEKTMSKVGI